jgi:hypothetical protein
VEPYFTVYVGLPLPLEYEGAFQVILYVPLLFCVIDGVPGLPRLGYMTSYSIVKVPLLFVPLRE